MNQLNSIILEGIVSDINSFERDDESVFKCLVVSGRTVKVDGKRVPENTVVPMETHGKVADACTSHLTTGRGIRVVGRLMTDERNVTVIYGDHVEFKPVYSKGLLDG